MKSLSITHPWYRNTYVVFLNPTQTGESFEILNQNKHDLSTLRKLIQDYDNLLNHKSVSNFQLNFESKRVNGYLFTF